MPFFLVSVKVLCKLMAIILGLVHSYVAGVAFDIPSMAMLDDYSGRWGSPGTMAEGSTMDHLGLG